MLIMREHNSKGYKPLDTLYPYLMSSLYTTIYLRCQAHPSALSSLRLTAAHSKHLTTLQPKGKNTAAEINE